MAHRIKLPVLMVAALTALAISACGSSNSSDTSSGSSTTATVTVPAITTSPATATTTPATTTTTTAASPATTKTTTTTTASAAAPGCATSQLAASIGAGGGAGMSQNRVSLQLKNTSGETCTLYGYPGVSWATSANGGEVGPGATRYDIATPKLVTLGPGAIASAPLDIVVGDGGLSASECHPLPVTGLRIYPPNQTAALFVAYSLPSPGACQVKTPSPMLQIGFMQLGAQSDTDQG
jgi:hypothetical protein